MKRGASLQVVAGGLLLVLATGCVFLARGTDRAASAYRDGEAQWQRGLEPAPVASPGFAQRAGEVVLGVRGRSDVVRAYQAYRAGLANVIPGTTYPQTRARFEAIKRLELLRASLRSNVDRASADVTLGVILTDAASGAGPQRAAMQKNAVAAFERAIREDPSNATAKLDLEVLLRASAPRTTARSRPARPTGRQRERDDNPLNPTSPARTEGNGF